MLGQSSFRTKLVGLVALPALALTTVTALAVKPKLAAASNAGDDLKSIEAVQKATVFLGKLGDERSQTMPYLISKGAVGRGEMDAARHATDVAEREFRTAVRALGSEGQTPSAVAALSVSDHLKTNRKTIDTGGPFPFFMWAAYNTESDLLLDFYGDSIDNSSNSDQVRTGGSLSRLSLARDSWAREASLMLISLQSNAIEQKHYGEFIALDNRADASLRAFYTTTPTATSQFVADRLKAKDVAVARSLVNKVRAEGTRPWKGPNPTLGYGRVPNVSSKSWFKAMDVRSNVITGLTDSLFQQLRTKASRTKSDAQRTATLFALGGLTTVLLALSLSLSIGRKLAQRLHNVSSQARTIAEERLPEVLQALRTPSAEALASSLPQVETGDNDEIGQLAHSFNTVLTTSVQTSLEHSSRRQRTMTDMLVNLGRRNQALIDRQLELIDRMESSQRDPDVLEQLFKLDHMVTRMRRNAENLLVLASEQGARPWSTAVTVAEILQAAASETADMNRVRLELSGADGRAVPGRLAVDFSHLVAELIENALAYSPPSSPVVVRTEHGALTLRIWILDQGVGMPEDELGQANERVTAPPDIDALTTDKIGFQVVGRLARRLGVRVRVQANPGRGIAVAINVPVALLESDASGAALPSASALADEPLVVPTVGGAARELAAAPTARDASMPPRSDDGPVRQPITTGPGGLPARGPRNQQGRPAPSGPPASSGAAAPGAMPARRSGNPAGTPVAAAPAAVAAAPTAPAPTPAGARPEARPRAAETTVDPFEVAPTTAQPAATVAESDAGAQASLAGVGAGLPARGPAPAAGPGATTASGLARRNPTASSFGTATAAAAAAAGEFRRLPVPGDAPSKGDQLSLDAFERSRRLADLRAGVDRGRSDQD